MPKTPTSPPADPLPDASMLLGEDRHGARVGLHLSSDAEPPDSGGGSGNKPRLLPVNGGLVMDVTRNKPQRDPHWASLEPLPARLQAIRCTIPSCTCDCFSPAKTQNRSCDNCKHGWVAHALDKLGFRHLYNCTQVEIVHPNIVFDIASLMLYGCQATPIRLKILLDRLFSVLQHEEVLQVLHGFGWKYEDYARGYILQDSQGIVLDRWTIATREEEPLILQQFLRFGETKAIAQQILLQDNNERPLDCIMHPPRAESDIKKFIERTNRVIGSTGSTITTRDTYTYTSSGKGTHHTSSQPPPPLVTSSHKNMRLPGVSTGTNGGSSTLPTSLGAHNLSPNGCSQHSFCSPINSTSPLAVSPLNRLQSMQPYDFRKERLSPDSRPPEGILPTSTLGLSTMAVTSPISSMPIMPPQSMALSLVNSSSSSVMATSDLSATDGGSDDDSNMALNLSRTALIDSVYASRKVKHLRKSANPMKRRWNPGVLSTMVTNPGSGKKRVQCNVCLKTFCDKGALKIHFSAVHLREMHKCTVEGCNMMFSSRRSRNRHSANPNPKLHTPHLRRKISPHDGRSANPNPIILAAGLIPGLGHLPLSESLMNSLNPANLSMHSNENHDKYRPGLIPIRNMVTPPLRNRSPEDKACISSPAHDQPYYINANDDVIPMPNFNKRTRLSDADEGEDASNEEEEDLPKNLSSKDDQRTTKGVRKRKSLNPTRCAAVPDDDDINRYTVSSDDMDVDDSSSDTFLQGDNSIDDNGLDGKSDDDKSTDSLVESNQSGIKRAPMIPLDKIKREKHETSGVDESEHASNHGDQTSSYDESSENALKQLENLSQGNFGDILQSRSLLSQQHLLPNALALPLAGMGLPGGGYRDLSPKMGCIDGFLGPHQGGGSSPSSPLSESQPFPGLPAFRDASLVGNVEIPVDKDNPRRCIACGKIFQNHFGVKTHYQNVHLKLMHKCTVEGCNAAFPSKRSRDRHSANLNLHRKLLSTSDKAFLDKTSPFAANLVSHPLRDEFLARIYGEPPVLPLSFDPYSKLPAALAESLLNNNHHTERLLQANHLGALAPHLIPGLLIPPPMAMHRGEMGHVETPVSSATPSPHNAASLPATPVPLSFSLEEDAPTPDDEGKLACKFCQKKFQEGNQLKEHYEKLHAPEMFRCTVDGCNKLFTSQKKRNAHSQNEEAHLHTNTSPTRDNAS